MPDGTKVPGVLSARIDVRPNKPWTLVLECYIEPHVYPTPQFLPDRFEKSGD